MSQKTYKILQKKYLKFYYIRFIKFNMELVIIGTIIFLGDNKFSGGFMALISVTITFQVKNFVYKLSKQLNSFDYS